MLCEKLANDENNNANTEINLDDDELPNLSDSSTPKESTQKDTGQVLLPQRQLSYPQQQEQALPQQIHVDQRILLRLIRESCSFPNYGVLLMKHLFP